MSPEQPNIPQVKEKPALMPIAGLVFGLFIWVVDAVIDVYILGEEQGLIENLFMPDESTELWMRSLVVIAFVAMGFFARKILLKHIALDKMLFSYQKHLEQSVSERTQELLEKTRELEVLASTDALTGLYNRRKFTEVLDQELSRYQRYKQKFCLINIDIDYFKSINDKYGHDVGDIVIKEFAEALKSNIRKSDSAGRWGGEEFLLLIIESDLQHALKVAEKIKQAIGSVTFDDVGKVTVSIGVSEVKEEDSHEDIVRRSDQALYKAKDNGRDRIEIIN